MCVLVISHRVFSDFNQMTVAAVFKNESTCCIGIINAMLLLLLLMVVTLFPRFFSGFVLLLLTFITLINARIDVLVSYLA